MRHLIHIQEFLASSLLEDYDGRFYTPSRYALDCASRINRSASPALSSSLVTNTIMQTNVGSARLASSESIDSDQSGIRADLGSFAGKLDTTGIQGDSNSENASTSKTLERRGSTESSTSGGSERVNLDQKRSSSIESSTSGGSEKFAHDRDLDLSSGEGTCSSDVRLPACELMLDPQLVVQKLAKIEPGHLYPGGEIKRLVDKCEWPQLFAMLQADRCLALTLFDEVPVRKDTFGRLAKGTVLVGIDAIEEKYFTRAGKSSKFSTSKHALKLSGNHPDAPLGCVPKGGSSGARQPGCTRAWKYCETAVTKHAMSLYKTIVGGISDAPFHGGKLFVPKAWSAFDVASSGEKEELLQNLIHKQEKAGV
ncbi:unnamed protein product [Discula destructiva]